MQKPSDWTAEDRARFCWCAREVRTGEWYFDDHRGVWWFHRSSDALRFIEQWPNTPVNVPGGVESQEPING